MKSNEMKIHKEIKQYLDTEFVPEEDFSDTRNFWYQKNNSYHKTGVPDFFILFLGVAIFIEVKDRHVQTQIQKEQEKKIINAGGICKIVYSVEEVEDILENVASNITIFTDSVNIRLSKGDSIRDAYLGGGCFLECDTHKTI